MNGNYKEICLEQLGDIGDSIKELESSPSEADRDKVYKKILTLIFLVNEI
jgi:hypothetical protein